MDCQLAQHGRAMMDFEVAARQRASRLQVDAEAELAAKGVTAATLPEDMEERYRVIDAALAGSPVYRARNLLSEWCSTHHGRAAEQAFEEIRPQMADALDAALVGPTTLDRNPGFQPPAYWARAWFHRTHNGWDDHPYQGYIHGAIVHRKYVAKVYPGDIYATRRWVLQQLPQRDYRDILEIGTSSGHHTVALSEVFPDATIHGVDPSLRMLEQAQRVGNALGHDWRLSVGVGEATGHADNSFDLVTAYAVHHEIPPKIVDAMFAEALRVLRPGGVLLIADVARYADLDRMTAWRFDAAAKFGGEPFWRVTASLDFAEGARKAGFVDVVGASRPPRNDPYYVIGIKPE